MSIERAAIVAEARSYLGTPFVHQGRVRGHGVDCVGLPICIARTFGMVAPGLDVTGYPRSPDGRTLLATADKYMTRIERSEMTVGDVLVLRFDALPQHMGIVGDYLHGGLSLIHALGTPDGKGRVVEHHLNDATMKRYVAAYRLPGIG